VIGDGNTMRISTEISEHLIDRRKAACSRRPSVAEQLTKKARGINRGSAKGLSCVETGVARGKGLLQGVGELASKDLAEY